MKITNLGRRSLLLAPLALLLAGGAPALQAQDSSLRWGAGLSIDNSVGKSGGFGPRTKLGDFDRMGFGLSLFGEKGLADRHAVRGRLEYHIFGQDDKFSINFNKVSTLTVFADYVFRLDESGSHDKGLYVFGGVGLVNGSVKGDWPNDSDKESGSNLGFSVGVGYNFSRNLGVETSYVEANDVVGEDDWPEKIGFSWVQVSLKYRF
jgi:opacity protein-like surface antigen